LRVAKAARLGVVGNALFFAELFDLFNVQLDAGPGNVSCLQSSNQLCKALIPFLPSITDRDSKIGVGGKSQPFIVLQVLKFAKPKKN
jgi:hypothetical protein